jgi:alpha-L-rhamnosidase
MAQAPSTLPLDPTRGIEPSTVHHTALSEEYIWTSGDVAARRSDSARFPWNRPDLRIAPHFFRAHFDVKALPKSATLYIAGPREAHIYLNGHRVDDFYSNIDEPINFHVFHADASRYLHLGANTIAIQAIRGKGTVSVGDTPDTAQLAYGEVLAVKIVPERFGVDAPALLISNATWRSTLHPPSNWMEAKLDETQWVPAESLGPIESNINFFQWSADAGMYGWPGYMGMSSFLRTYLLSPSAITHIYAGRSTFLHLDSLTGNDPGNSLLINRGLAEATTDAEAPSILLDFGREIAGRIIVESASSLPATLSVAYGESELEALATGISTGQQGGNYLGTNLLEVPANGVARGPKSAFRYVRIRFLKGAPQEIFKSIRAEGIYYPVEYKGSFESSDPLLNRIWETGAYTAHLCMQDDIWDAPKRDRGRWAGDLAVETRTISTVFGESALTADTLKALVPTGFHDVNGIPGYSALWIVALSDLYLRTGDLTMLSSLHEGLLHILAVMDSEMDANGQFVNPGKHWMFIDWAPDLYAFTPEARTGTQLQYAHAYQMASQLLAALQDNQNSQKYEGQAGRALKAAQVLREKNGTYGRTWQLNALAILSDPDADTSTIWRDVLSHVKQDSSTDQVISPYFGATLLDAMAATHHSREALDWIRVYWGGMLDEDASSFWESYDLRWPKTNPHLSLQADGTSGFFVSLAHGWSSSPTSWLSENVLGIVPDKPGYDNVIIRPNLLGLEFARGTVPTPHGLITISIDAKRGLTLDLPQHVQATLEYAGKTHSLQEAGHFSFPADTSH